MKLTLLAALLLPLAAPAEAPPAPLQPQARSEPSSEDPDCVSIVRQVAGDERPQPRLRLDQQPDAKLLLAVDREVNGCRQATIVRDGFAPRP